MFFCKVCGKQFERKHYAGRLPYYCSYECAHPLKAIKLPNCQFCGKELEHKKAGNPRRSCSQKCRDGIAGAKAKIARRMTRNCEICQAEFTTNRKATKACSVICQRERVRRIRAANHKEYMATKPKTKTLICSWCKEPVETSSSNPTRHLRHDNCRIEYRKHRNRVKNVRRQTSGKQTATKTTLEQVAEWSSYTCHLCQVPIDMTVPRNSKYGATIDHVIPLTKGGTDEPENLKLAHWICNVKKSNKLVGANA